MIYAPKGVQMIAEQLIITPRRDWQRDGFDNKSGFWCPSLRDENWMVWVKKGLELD
jgi:hypothetical protein